MTKCALLIGHRTNASRAKASGDAQAPGEVYRHHDRCTDEAMQQDSRLVPSAGPQRVRFEQIVRNFRWL